MDKAQARLTALDGYVDKLRSYLQNSDPNQSEVPKELKELKGIPSLENAFKDWRDNEQKVPNLSTTRASELLATYDKWFAKRKESWANLSNQIKKIGPLPPVAPGTRSKFVNDARELLRKMQPDKLDISTWEKFNERLDKDSEIAEWLRIWAELNGDRKIQIAETAQTNGLLPEWLKTEARKVLEARDKALADRTAAERKAMQDKTKAANTPKPEINNADSLEEGTHPIYVLLSREPSEFQSLLKKTKLNVDENMQVYVGEMTASDLFSTQKLAPHNAALNKWIRNTDKNSLSFYESINSPLVDSIEFSSDGYLNRLPPVESEKELWKTQKGSVVGRIVARKESKTEQDPKGILFDLRLIKTAVVSDAPIFRQSLTVRLLRTRPSELPRLVSLINRLNFGAGITVSYKLRRMSSTDEPYKLELGKEAGAQYRVASPNSDAPQPLSGKPNIEKSISDLEDGIKSLRKQIDNVGKRDAGRDEKIAGYEKDIKAKESQIADLRSQNVSPEKPREMPAPSLPDGEYMLVALTSNGGVLDICKIQLVADKSNSAERTPNKP